LQKMYSFFLLKESLHLIRLVPRLLRFATHKFHQPKQVFGCHLTFSHWRRHIYPQYLCEQGGFPQLRAKAREDLRSKAFFHKFVRSTVCDGVLFVGTGLPDGPWIGAESCGTSPCITKFLTYRRGRPPDVPWVSKRTFGNYQCYCKFYDFL